MQVARGYARSIVSSYTRGILRRAPSRQSLLRYRASGTDDEYVPSTSSRTRDISTQIDSRDFRRAGTITKWIEFAYRASKNVFRKHSSHFRTKNSRGPAFVLENVRPRSQSPPVCARRNDRELTTSASSTLTRARLEHGTVPNPALSQRTNGHNDT